MNLFKFKINTLSENNLYSYLKKISNSFEPSLELQVCNLKDYASKIKNNAYIIESYFINKLVGILAIYLNSDTAYITHISISPKYQKFGLGSKMLEIAIKKTRELNYDEIKLECHKNNQKALSFYKKNGFKIEETNKDKYLLKYTLPKVSICCLTYNHAKYIRQALDSFIIQKTNFPFEVLIHDDASTDNTAEIIKEYQEKYPNIIKPIYQKRNQFSKGVCISKEFNFPRVKGKYVALCEGDDYWIDENKLQKQVDFLDNNPDYSICFHNVRRVFEIDNRDDDIYPTEEVKSICPIFDLNNLLKTNFIQTNSVMYRWEAVKNISEIFPIGILPEDWYLHLLFAKEGKIKYLNEVMAVYTINSGGIWSQSFDENNDAFFLKIYKKHLRFNDIVCKNIYKNSRHGKEYFLLYFDMLTTPLIKNNKNFKLLLLKIKYWKYLFFSTYKKLKLLSLCI
jgi:glycosyltransferase involved in cell wall biosynthesis